MVLITSNAPPDLHHANDFIKASWHCSWLKLPTCLCYLRHF